VVMIVAMLIWATHVARWNQLSVLVLASGLHGLAREERICCSTSRKVQGPQVMPSV